MSLEDFIAGLPKAELHLHIEGTLEPEMMLALGERNGVDLPYRTVEEARQAYDFSCLQDFLDVYYAGMSVLRERADFRDLTRAYLERARADAVTHVEIFFDPQAHLERGVAFETVLGGLVEALEAAEREAGLTSRLIMCFLRHLPEASAFEVLEHARRHRQHIHGVGLDSSELGHPPEKFERVFAAARADGFVPVAHAGEEGPAAYVRGSLDRLGITRIDHGNRAMDDPALVRRIRDAGIALTVCPLSNLKLGVVDDMRRHPLAAMLDAGLLATVNSDDPAYFGGYINDNYRAVQRALDLDRETLATLAANSYRGSFMSDAHKREALDRLEAYCRA